MATKILMRNEVTRELLATQAKVDGSVYQKYIANGFEPIGEINGFDIYVKGI